MKRRGFLRGIAAMLLTPALFKKKKKLSKEVRTALTKAKKKRRWQARTTVTMTM